MPYELVPTRQFERTSARFLRRHPELRDRFTRVLNELRVDPFQPHLRLHSLRGRLGGSHAVSLTYEYRIVLILFVEEERITLVDIGSHDDVYR